MSSASLDSLDAARNTTAFLATALQTVNAAVGKKKQFPDRFRPLGDDWNKIANGLVKLSPTDAVAAGADWSNLVAFVSASTAHASDAYGAAAAVSAQAQAILRIDPTGGTLTTHHVALVRTSLASGAYREAKMVVDKDIHNFPDKESSGDSVLSNGYITVNSNLTAPLTTHLVQEYFLLAGMVCIGLHEWSRAQALLEHVLCLPSQQKATGYMLEAFKKWTLVSILANGKVSSLPRAASGGALKSARTIAKPYDTLAAAYAAKDTRKLQAEIVEAGNELLESGNYGLALQVLYQQRSMAIKKLARTFTAVPMDTVATRLGVSKDEAAGYVQQLVQEGQFSGRVEQSGSETVLRFEQEGADTTTQADRVRMQSELALQAHRIQELAVHVQEADRKLALSREYTEHVKRERNAKGTLEPQGAAPPAGEDEDQMDVSNAGPQSDDEDESEMAEGR